MLGKERLEQMKTGAKKPNNRLYLYSLDVRPYFMKKFVTRLPHLTIFIFITFQRNPYSVDKAIIHKAFMSKWYRS
mgnify:CR=1 FL=1